MSVILMLFSGLQVSVAIMSPAVDENVIVDMVRQVQEGKDIIYGVRKERKTDTFFKR